MSKIYNLAFVSESLEIRWYQLREAGDFTIEQFEYSFSDLPLSGSEILILPSSCGLPFQLELPFGDPDKIKKVIPQFVADQYSEVNENWIFSWHLAAPPPDSEKPSWKISGMAFPKEFSPSILAPQVSWRLAIPDVFLIKSEERSAFRVVSPVADFVAVFSGKDQIDRVLRDSSIPLMPVLSASGISKIGEVELFKQPSDIFSKIVGFEQEPGFFDLSGWQQKSLAKNLRWLASAMMAMLLGLVFLSHFFLWFECYLTESAADRTVNSMRDAFTATFPGVPVIDAVSQLKRKKSELETSLKEAGSVPNVSWLSVLLLASEASDTGVRLTKIVGKDDGIRFQGFATDYTSLEAFRRKIESNGLIDKVTTPESRKNGDVVVFVLEGKWKK